MNKMTNNEMLIKIIHTTEFLDWCAGLYDVLTYPMYTMNRHEGLLIFMEADDETFIIDTDTLEIVAGDFNSLESIAMYLNKFVTELFTSTIIMDSPVIVTRKNIIELIDLLKTPGVNSKQKSIDILQQLIIQYQD